MSTASVSDEAPVLVELDGGVAVVTLHRPTRSNALDVRAWQALSDVLCHLDSDAACRAVVLTGAGSCFSAGIDLEDRLRREGAGVVEDADLRTRLYLRVVEQVHDLRPPVIAAVNGPAVGAGFALACACDLRVVGARASFAAPFTTAGLSGADLGLTWFLPRLIGPQAAGQVLLSGGTLSADEATAAGLGLPADGDALDHATRLATQIARQPAYGVQATKSMLAASLAAGGQREHLRAELRAQTLCALTDAYQAHGESARDRTAGPHHRERTWS